jgi:hypothetical protein
LQSNHRCFGRAWPQHGPDGLGENNVKWIFLLVLSIGASIAMTALGCLIVGRPIATGLASFSQGNLLPFLVLVGAWVCLINDMAAASKLSNILGYKVQFREITWYPNETSMWIIPLRRKLRVLYPVTIILSCVMLAVQISRF